MDLLTHLFLPLTGAYVIYKERLDQPLWLAPLLAPFAVLPDADKVLVAPAPLHSLLTMGPLCVALLGVEYWWRGELSLAPVVVALVGSHLVLDVVGGGPVPLLWPLTTAGVGLEYPAQTVFGAGPLGMGVTVEGSVISSNTSSPAASNRTYGFIRGAGVSSMLLFGVVYITDQLGWQEE